MRVLWLNAGPLLPLDKGGKLRTWHLMRHLAQRHEITYLAFEEAALSAADRGLMREVSSHVESIPRSDPPKGTLRFYADAARHVLDPVPYAVAKYRSAAYRHRVVQVLDRDRFDLVVCDFLVPAVNLPDRLPCPSVLFTHNVEAEIWRRHASTTTSRLSRGLLASQWQRMLRFERRTLARFDLVLAVSDADRATFERLYPAALRHPIRVVQTGVETRFFAPSPDEPIRDRLVFTGSMDWLPNEDGMLHFVRDVLPRIRAAEPGATLSIIGRAPTPAVRRLAEQAGIEVTGRVEDVRPHVARGAVYVVPLRVGGGTRLKIFEAMSMAKAVVSTTVGAEGLPVIAGHHLEIADDPDRFAEAVVALIRHPDRRRELERAARELVVERYDWAAVAEPFEEALVRVAADAHAATSHETSPESVRVAHALSSPEARES